MDLNLSIDFAELLIDVKLKTNIAICILASGTRRSDPSGQVKVHLDRLDIYNNA